MYCGQSATSEVFLIFTSQLYSCLCNCDAIFSYIDKRAVLHATGILPTPNRGLLPSPHFWWVVNQHNRLYEYIYIGNGNISFQLPTISYSLQLNMTHDTFEYEMRHHLYTIYLVYPTRDHVWGYYVTPYMGILIVSLTSTLHQQEINIRAIQGLK